MLLNLILIFTGAFYYLPFFNRGIVLYDEGYYLHIADRLLNGGVPYRDFFLQFPPLYFYFLSLFFKIFGETVIVERILIFVICISILYLNLKIIDKMNFINPRLKIIAFLSMISFGFPLINNSGILAWVSVLSSGLLIYSVLNWLDNSRNVFIIGIFLALQFALKQNLGIYFLILTNVFIFINSKRKFKDLIITNFAFFIISSSWIVLFFNSNWNLLREFIDFNRTYARIYPLSYPPISFILQPLGLLKLIPYYLPILYLLVLIRNLKKVKPSIIFFLAVALVGFFGTIFPTSDLLHVYPFYSLILIGGLLIFNKRKIVLTLTIISIIIGFYLTLFREYYRYQPQYTLQTVSLNLPKTKGILVDKPLANGLLGLNEFIKNNGQEKKYVLAYPFSPMLYFVLDIKNPSRYSIYYPGYLTEFQENKVIDEINSKNVKYIVTVSNYKFNTPISKFIQKQKEVYNNGIFKIFEII